MQRHLFRLIVGAAVFISVAFLVRHLRNPERAWNRFQEMKLDMIQSFEILRPQTASYKFFKEENLWHVLPGEDIPLKFEVDQEQVNNTVNTIAALNIGDIVLDGKERHKELELDDENAVRLKVFTNSFKAVLDMYVGKRSVAFRTSYVRAANRDEVFIAKGLVRSDINRNIAFWRSKKILQCDINDISVIVIEQKFYTLVFAKDNEGQWYVSSGEKRTKVNKEKFANLLDQIEVIKADGFADEEGVTTDALGFDKPYAGLTLTYTSGKQEQVIVGKSSDPHYYVKNTSKDIVYLLSAYKVRRIFEREIQDFVKK
ncbi:MAG: DUF4340 domain-containing protein [Elusimicrobiota bacterium]